MTPQTKPCRDCGETKPLTAFWAAKREKDGRRSECAMCSSERRRWRNANPIVRGPEYVEEDRGHDTPCWMWTGGLEKKGYGVSTLNGQWMHAHRRFYIERRGPIPEGLCIDHLCRVPACVNPDHMEVVTYGENLRRGLRAKITWDDVHAIRASGESASALSDRYGVCVNQIYKIRKFERWNTP